MKITINTENWDFIKDLIDVIKKYSRKVCWKIWD